MKKIISLTISLCLVLGSFSFCFADFTSTDSSNLSDIKSKVSQIYSAMPTYTQISGISSSLTTINNNLSTIASRLIYSNHSIADLVDSIVTWMNPIYLRLQDILQATTDPAFNAITGLLGYPSTDSSTGVTTWNSYLRTLSSALTNNGLTGDFNVQANGHTWLVDTNTNTVRVFTYSPNGTYSSINEPWFGGSPLGNLAYIVRNMSDNDVINYSSRYAADLTGYNSQQVGLSWTDIEQSVTFTPSSSTNGIYTWLKNIQAPVARLSYVLASDERIEAQEAAAANEEAVVDNFIDSTGTGSVGVSDFGSLSDASGAMKSNFNTGQSAAGVFNVFDDSHFLYLSQSAADQLDTTGSNNRLLRSSENDYDTPALDRYYEELYVILEVNKDD